MLNCSWGTNVTVTVVLPEAYPEAEPVNVKVYVPTDDDEHVTEDPLMVTVRPLLMLLLAKETEAPDGDDVADAVKVTDDPATAYCWATEPTVM